MAPSSIPVLCLGSSGTAFARLAGSVHRASQRVRLARVDLRREGAGGILALPHGSEASYLTLALDGLEALDDSGQGTLASYLDESSPRLICATRVSAEDLTGTFRADLLGQLSTVTVDTPALRERGREIGSLASERIAMLAREIDLHEAPTLTESATAALASHNWPGDVTEFDAVLLATLLREPPSATIEASDLLWPRQPAALSTSTPSATIRPRDSEPPLTPSLPEPPRETVAAPPLDAAAEPLDTLESVAVELAHQLKNPLVTVKTFVSNAERMDHEEMTRFREIALEGIDRIDGPLDQILDFSRLPGSTDDTLEVALELTKSLESVAPKLDAKGISVQGIPPSLLPARGSTANLDFALSTLTQHIAETIEPQSILMIARPSADLVLLHYRESGASTHLRGATGNPDSSFPLALLLVRGALTRMGGGLRTSHAHTEVTVELSFTPA
ncbi:MAG: histidine kinase dimerization/phospho-acceptor domain-containing protein [Candidatus Binatia bacterium]|nr:histidine kinase dimerization/phospho-acceptor domain-containing protein [Candidatus Binatia bacterium]